MSNREHRSRSSDLSGGVGSQYTYQSYTTYGTTATASQAQPGTESTSASSRMRVRVARRKDETGSYLPHRHEHSEEGSRKKHRIIKHKDGFIGATDVISESTGTHVEVDPVSTSELTKFPTGESTVTVEDNRRHRHEGYNREHHKWAEKKRSLELLKIQPRRGGMYDDQTFTQLSTEDPGLVPRESKYKVNQFTTTIDESIIDTRGSETTNTKIDDTFGQPIPKEEVFPEAAKLKKMKTRGLDGNTEEPESEEYDDKKKEEILRNIYLYREKLYPRRRRDVMLANPLPIPKGLELNGTTQDGMYSKDVSHELKTETAIEDGQAPPFRPPESEAKVDPSQFKYDQMERYMDQAQPGSVNTARKIVSNIDQLGVEPGREGARASFNPPVNPPIPPEPKPKPAPSVSFYSDAALNEQKDQNRKNDQLTSESALVTANSKSAEFVETSNPNHSAGNAYVEVSDDMASLKRGEEEEEEEEDDEEEEEEEDQN